MNRAACISLILAMLLALPSHAPAQPAAQDAREAQTRLSRSLIEGYAKLRREDPHLAWERYLAPDLIQHNPEIAEGTAAHDKFMADRRAAHPDKYLAPEQYVNIVDNILADGELVAIKSRLYTSPTDRGRTFVDLWRVAGGRLVEHWDVIQPIPDGAPNPASTGCGEANSYAQGAQAGDTAAHPTCGPNGNPAHREAALATVTAYLALGSSAGHEREAVETYVAQDFIQHSPHIRPGKAGLAAYLGERAASGKAVGRVSQTAHVLADGDFVLVHRRVVTPENPRGTAYADLFRVRDGHIAEHWDVIQPIPAYSVAGRSMVLGPLEPERHAGPRRPEEAP